jgi:transposase
MAKYDKQFKLKIVRQCLSGREGVKTIARTHDLAHSMVRRWVASYQQHGACGLAKKFGRYDARFKLKVLRRMARDGLSLQQVAALFDIRSPGLIAMWRRRYDAGGVGALAPKPRGRPKAMATPKKPPKPTPIKPDEELTREELLDALADSRAELAYLKKLDALIQGKKAAAQKKRS